MDPTNLTAIGDQYSLGCVLYFCISGQFPFPEGTAVEKMMSHQTKAPPSIHGLCPDITAEVVAAVERLMQKEPSARYANTAEALTALRPFAGVTSAHGRQPLRAGGLREPKLGVPPEPPRAPAKGSIPPAPAIPAVPRPPSPAERRTSAPVRGGSSPDAPSPTRPKSAPSAPPAAQPVHAPRPAPPRANLGVAKDAQGGSSWEERLGPVGIAIFALVACAIAWFVTYKFF
jgi:serine/threonine-protein kinase